MRLGRHKTPKVWSIMLFLLVKNKHYIEIKAQIDFLYLTLYMHVSCQHLVFEWNSKTDLLLFDSEIHVCVNRKTLQM